VSGEYIYTMHRLSRVHPPDKEVLKDITLAFFPGAKIGVLGPNGAGKSTLLRIMAGVDQEFRGEAALDITSGMLTRVRSEVPEERVGRRRRRIVIDCDIAPRLRRLGKKITHVGARHRRTARFHDCTRGLQIGDRAIEHRQ